MSFETKRIALTAGAAPIDLAVDADIALTELGIAAANVAIQNVSTRIARYQETTTAPAGTATDTGHTLSGGDGVLVQVLYGEPFWWWSASGATIAISPAAPSLVRDG